MNARASAIRVATDTLAQGGRKRAAVFAAIAQDLYDGPAAVSYRAIARRYIDGGSPFVPGVWKRSALDHLTGRLVDDGWLVIVTEHAGLGHPPRVWDLGPAVVRAYAASQAAGAGVAS